MIVGVDFDNTIVCYDTAFHLAACERGLIPAELPPLKEQVRDYLRSTGREDDWTELQGFVYGARMETVSPFSGAASCIRGLVERGEEVFIVSHKTRHPYRGTRYDLHEAARRWLDTSGFLIAAGLTPERTFFEFSREEKLRRIATLGCTHFIDDLPEILTAPQFPKSAAPLLFAPLSATASTGLTRFDSWAGIAAYFRGVDG